MSHCDLLGGERKCNEIWVVIVIFISAECQIYTKCPQVVHREERETQERHLLLDPMVLQSTTSMRTICHTEKEGYRGLDPSD